MPRGFFLLFLFAFEIKDSTCKTTDTIGSRAVTADSDNDDAITTTARAMTAPKECDPTITSHSRYTKLTVIQYLYYCCITDVVDY